MKSLVFSILFPMKPFSPRKRRLFFWSLVFLFFLLSPLLVGYAFGYRYSFDRGIFLYTGSITIKTQPEDVLFFLDGKKLQKKKPDALTGAYHFDGIEPGEHTLRVTAPGLQVWEKRIAIHSGRATEFWNVVLPKKRYQPERKGPMLSSLYFFALSPSGEYALFARTQSETLEILLFSFTEQTLRTVLSLPQGSLPKEKRLRILEWSPDERAIILTLLAPPTSFENLSFPSLFSFSQEEEQERGEGQESAPKQRADKENIDRTPILKHLVLSLGNAPSSSSSFLFTPPPQDEQERIFFARWLPTQEQAVVFLAREDAHKPEGAIRAFSLSENNELFSLPYVLGYDLSEERLLFLSSEDRIVYAAPLKALLQREQKEVLQVSSRALSSASFPTQLIFYDEDRMVFLTPERELFLFLRDEDGVATLEKKGEHILGTSFSNDGKKLLFWDKATLFVFFTRPWEVQPRRKEGEQLVLAKFIQGIYDAQWMDDYEHVLFLAGKTLYLVSLDGRDGHVLFPLFAFSSEGTPFSYRSEKEEIFFLQDVSGQENASALFSFRLLEKKAALFPF